MLTPLTPGARRLLEACERVMPEARAVVISAPLDRPDSFVELRFGQSTPVFSLAIPFDSRAPGREVE